MHGSETEFCFASPWVFKRVCFFVFFYKVLKLLHTSYRLIESWEFPSRNLGNPNHISEKLADLKMGIGVLIEVSRRAVDQ